MIIIIIICVAIVINFLIIIKLPHFDGISMEVLACAKG